MVSAVSRQILTARGRLLADTNGQVARKPHPIVRMGTRESPRLEGIAVENQFVLSQARAARWASAISASDI